MSRSYAVRKLLTAAALLISVSAGMGAAPDRQAENLEGAVPAVVRILGCNVAGCDVGLGSGVIIHPSGVVLTANHVTLADPKDPFSQLEDFLIEMSESAQAVPEPRYRARLIAFKPESDLALLRIYWDERANRPVDAAALSELPVLPLADASTITLGERVHVLGYPIAGGRAINYTLSVVGGFDESGALVKLSTTLSEGNSGGPALVERGGHFEIAGVVLRRRGTLGEVGVLRRIDQMQGLQWLANVQRVWADNIVVSTQGAGAAAGLQIQADVHALDMVGRRLYLLAYVFAADTYQPWRPSSTRLPTSATGQVVFSGEFTAHYPVEPVQTMKLAQPRLGSDPQQLLLRLILWDAEATQILWQDTEWRRPQPPVETALLPPAQAPLPELTAAAPPAAPTPTPAAPTPSALFETTAPDLPATATAITQLLATSIAATLTAQPTATPTSTPTPDSAATAAADARLRQTSIAATLTALPAATATPTGTPDLSQVIATSVAATLTALPTETPTRAPTPAPALTSAPTATRVPIPTSTGTPTRTPTSTWTPMPTSTKTRTPMPTATRTPAPPPCRIGVLYCEDFDDGNAHGWRLMDGDGQPSFGWKVVQDGTNYVFMGEGHQWTTLDNHAWNDYRYSFRLKLIRGGIHLNYRVAEGRYFIGFNENNMYLSKQLRDSFTDLATTSSGYTFNRWYQLEIAGWAGHIQIYVDGKLQLDYVDPAPFLKGSIAFETLDNSAAQVDDIEVRPAGLETEQTAASQVYSYSEHSELAIAAATLNVREGPGSSYPVLGTARAGERYMITGANSNRTWWQIAYQGRTGWVSDAYVKLQN